jgi:hypothetical protein
MRGGIMPLNGDDWVKSGKVESEEAALGGVWDHAAGDLLSGVGVDEFAPGVFV